MYDAQKRTQSHHVTKACVSAQHIYALGKKKWREKKKKKKSMLSNERNRYGICCVVQHHYVTDRLYMNTCMRGAHITVDHIFFRKLNAHHSSCCNYSGSGGFSSNDKKHVWIVKTMSFKWQRAHFKMGILLAFESMCFIFCHFLSTTKQQQSCVLKHSFR